jgi:hypothetical protein
MTENRSTQRCEVLSCKECYHSVTTASHIIGSWQGTCVLLPPAVICVGGTTNSAQLMSAFPPVSDKISCHQFQPKGG